jgi:hypothetical protein
MSSCGAVAGAAPSDEASVSASGLNVRRWLFLIVIVGAVVLFRAMLVASYATEMPFADQWDAEIDRLYRPLVEGNLRWPDLFSPHNEHRILFTRLLGLSVFGLNEFQFDNVVESFANVLVYAGVFTMLLVPLARELPNRALLPFAQTAILFGALPYAWENVASGFQNAFWFLAGWSIAALWTITHSGRRAFCSIGIASCCSALAIFTLASGCLTSIAVATVGLVLYRNGRLTLRQLVVLESALLAVFLLGLALVPEVPHTVPMHARTFGEFLTATLRVLSWPFPVGWAAPVIWWPTAVLLARRGVLRIGPPLPRIDLFLLGVAIWVGLQAAAIAYSRGHADGAFPTSRYFDLLALGLGMNLLIASRMLYSWRPIGRWPVRLRAAAEVVNGTIAVGCIAALVTLGVHGFHWLGERRSNQLVAERATATFIEGTDPHAFEQIPRHQLPHPNPVRLAKLLTTPSIVQMMPSAIGPPAELRWSACPLLAAPGTFPTTPSFAGAVGTFSDRGNLNIGECTSEPLTTQRTYVRVAVAGYLSESGMSLRLQTANAPHASSVRPDGPTGERWSSEHIAVPAQPFVVIASDANSNFWFAFAAPREEGRLSFAAARLKAAANELLARVKP